VLHDTVRDLKKLGAEATTSLKDALTDAPAGAASRRALDAMGELVQRLDRFELVSAAPQCRPIASDEAPVEPNAIQVPALPATAPGDYDPH
jgi:hypothetical protein